MSRLGGRLVTDAELRALFDDPATGYLDTVSVHADTNLVLPPEAAGEGCNQGCDPDLWWAGPFELRTRRPVAAGAELTLDYATITDDPDLRLDCRCGAAQCRGVVSSLASVAPHTRKCRLAADSVAHTEVRRVRCLPCG